MTSSESQSVKVMGCAGMHMGTAPSDVAAVGVETSRPLIGDLGGTAFPLHGMEQDLDRPSPFCLVAAQSRGLSEVPHNFVNCRVAWQRAKLRALEPAGCWWEAWLQGLAHQGRSLSWTCPQRSSHFR